MPNTVRVPDTIATPESFSDWLRSLTRLEAPVYVWTQFVFSRHSFHGQPEQIGDPVPGARRQQRRLPIFALSRHVGSSGDQSLSGWFVVLDLPEQHLHKIVTVADREFWHRALLPALRARYPTIAPVYFMQRELQKALTALQDSLPAEHRLNLIRASTKERIAGRTRTPQSPHRTYRSNVTYTQESPDLAFQLAHERGQSFKTLTVEINRTAPDGVTESLAAFAVSKDGWMSWDSLKGRIEVPLERVLVDSSAERLRLFRNRGLLERGYKPEVPLSIEFDDNVLDDRRLLRSFGSLMLKYPKSAKAVLHRNPYYHMSLSDAADGSAFDLWVLTSRRVLLVPRLRASEPALSRLVRYITENFRDARVANYVDAE